jgi:tRNA(adenine34) deaminase
MNNPPLDDHYWMRRALQLALQADALGEVPVGALVVLDNEIIGEGWNSPITNHDPTAHAEIMALRNAAASVQNYRLPKSTLYVTLEPCAMCAGAIVHSRVERVVFATLEPKAGVVVSNNHFFDEPSLNHKVNYEGGVCEGEASYIVKSFFKRRRAEAKAAKNQLKAVKMSPDLN